MNKFIFGALCSALVFQSIAADKSNDHVGWVIGGGIGSASITVEPKDQSGLVNTDDTARVLSVVGGYNFSPTFGLEFDISKSADITDENTQLDAYFLGTSFTPKLIIQVNENFSLYLKGGLQFIAYEQDIDSYYYSSNRTWNGIDPVFGAGLQLGINTDVKIRLDYKYSRLTLERSDNSIFGFVIFSEEMDITYSTLMITVNYQF